MDLQGILGWLSYHMMEILNYGDLLTYTDRANYWDAVNAMLI